MCTEKKYLLLLMFIFLLMCIGQKLTLMMGCVCGNLSTHNGVVERLVISMKLVHDGFSHVKSISFRLLFLPNLQTSIKR